MYNLREGQTVDEALQIFFDQETDESDNSETEVDDDMMIEKNEMKITQMPIWITYSLQEKITNQMII